MFRRCLWLVLASVLGLVVVLPGAAAGGGCHPPAGLEMTSSSRSVVTIGECAFQDTVTYIEAGSSVTWINKDQVAHTVTGAANSWGDELFMDMGDKVTYTFGKPGVFPYYCALHPSMVGAVVVGDAPRADGDAGVEALEDAAAASTTLGDAEASSGGALDHPAIGLGVVGLLGATLVLGRRFRLRRKAG